MRSRHSTDRWCSQRRAPAFERGFSLNELLLVLAIIGLTVMIAVPTVQRSRTQSRTMQGVSRVKGLIDMARTEALKRHSPVLVDLSPGQQTFFVFEDWDPNGTDVGTNGDGTFNGNEDQILVRRMDAHVEFTSSPAGDPDGLAAVGVLTYISDGSLSSNGGAVYLRDRNNNIFRVNVNSFTGSARTEMWIASDSRWSPRREDWEWKF